MAWEAVDWFQARDGKRFVLCRLESARSTWCQDRTQWAILEGHRDSAEAWTEHTDAAPGKWDEVKALGYWDAD